MMTTDTQPKIGVIGTGAIAGFYGLMLLRSGLDVRFLARSGHGHLAAEGIRVDSSTLGSMHGNIRVCRQIEELRECDWILVTTKSTANHEVAGLLQRLSGTGARIVLLQNGFGNEDRLRLLLPADMPLFAGLCFIYARRTAPGKILHQGGGAVNIGYHSGLPDDGQGSEQAGILVGLFNAAGVKSQQVDVAQARWQKLVWNVPYNGLSVVLDASTDEMMDTPATHALLVDLMQEVVTAAAACGCPLPDTLVPAMLKTTAQMASYYPSMHGDYMAGLPLELEAIYRAPLAAAEQAGAVMHKTGMLLQQLEFLQARKGRS